MAYNLYSKPQKKRKNEDEEDEPYHWKPKKGKEEDYSKLVLSSQLQSLFPVFPKLKHVLCLLNHSYSMQTLSKDFLKGNDLSIYQNIKEEFHVEIIQVKISHGFHGEESHKDYSIEINGKKKKFEIKDLEMLIDFLDCQDFEERFGSETIIPITYDIPKIQPLFGSFHPVGNEGGQADLQYIQAGFLIRPKKKYKFPKKKRDIHFKFQ